jgi:DNA-directed RNA polymerase specialized sigma subunit
MQEKMDKQKVIELLEYHGGIDEEIGARRKFIAELETYYDTSKAINYDGMPKGQYHISSPTEQAALNVPQFVSKEIRQYTEEIEEMQKLKCEIVKEVLRLKLKQKQVIMCFYFQNMRWVQIGDLLHYSERQCKNIRDEAVESLAVLFWNNKTIAGYAIKE